MALGEIIWAPLLLRPRQVIVRWTGATAHDLHWGDGTITRNVPAGRAMLHAYTAAGVYTVSAATGEAVQAVGQLMVRDDPTPNVAPGHAPDNPAFVRLTFNEPATAPAGGVLVSRYEVAWGDGSDPVQVTGTPGTFTERALPDGSYTVKVTDLATRRIARLPVSVTSPAADPDFRLTYDGTDTSGMTVVAECLAKQAGKDALLDWDDDGAADVFTAVGQKASHRYGTAGPRIVQGYYADGSTDGGAWDVEVPQKKGRLTKPVSEIIARPDPFDDRAIWARWAGSVTAYTLAWGDGTSDRMTSWQPPKRHVYPAYGRYLITGTNELGHSKELWIELAAPTGEGDPEITGGQLEVALRWPQAAAAGSWRVEWPDWPAEEITPTAGEPYVRPALPGRRQVVATHVESGHTARAVATVTDRPYGVDFDIQVDGRTVKVRRTLPEVPEPPGRWWRVWWGDEWDLDPASAAPFRRPEALPDDTWVSHTYDQPGAYFIEVGSPSQGGLVYYRVKQVTIP